MIIGMGTPVQTLPVSAAALREVDLVGVFRYAHAYPAAIELLARGHPRLPDVAKLVTHRFRGLDAVPAAFDMAGRAKDDCGNLVLKVMKGEPGLPTVLSAPTWGFYDVNFGGKPFTFQRGYGSYVMENVLFKVSYPGKRGTLGYLFPFSGCKTNIGGS